MGSIPHQNEAVEDMYSRQMYSNTLKAFSQVSHEAPIINQIDKQQSYVFTLATHNLPMVIFTQGLQQYALDAGRDLFKVVKITHPMASYFI